MNWIEQKIIKLEKIINYIYCKVKNLTNIHNELDGLQGGHGGQHYHLTEEQYNCVIDYCGGNPHNTTKEDIGLGNVDNTSDLDKPISTATQNALNLKVDKVAGKQLSTEDYTTTEKNKLAGIQPGAEANVNADWNATSGDAQILNKPTTFPPSTHTHAVGDVTGLQTALNNKLNTPTMTNNYYGLWDDINKKFINGQLSQDINGNIGIGATPTDSKVGLSPLVNQTALKVLNYSLTGSNIQPALDINGTWNTSGTPTLIKANVTNTASNASSLLMDLQVNSSSLFKIDRTGNMILSNNATVGAVWGLLGWVSFQGRFLSLNGVAAGGTDFFNSSISYNSATTVNGTVNFNRFGNNFTHSNTGNLVGNIIAVTSTINQTGGANGITRGLYINPTLTSAADWRSIEWSNNTGYGLYGTGTANNFLAGNLGIGKLLPVEKLDVDGNVKAIDFKGQAVKFNLQTSISPTPNTLVPKTDGSGLIWYDNSSIAKNIATIPSEWSFGFGGVATSDNYDVTIGTRSKLNVTSSSQSVSIGADTIKYGTSYRSNAIGYGALVFGGGSYNNAFGVNSIGNSSTSQRSTAIGESALYCGGTDNIAIGYRAGMPQYFSDKGATSLQNIYLGGLSSTVSVLDNTVNQINIGYNVVGKGSNTIEFGNDNIISTYLKGKIILNERLKLASYTKAQRNALTSKTVGEMIWQTDNGNSGIRVYDGTNWLAIQTTID